MDTAPGRLVRRMTELLATARSDRTGGTPPASLVGDLADLVPGVVCSFCELDLPTRRLLNYRDTNGSSGNPGPDHPYWRLRHEHPTCRYTLTTGRLDVVQISDFLSSRELRSRRIYAELFAPEGIEHLISVPLPTAPQRTRVFLIGRDSGTGFSETERAILTLRQPHLYQLYRDAANRDGPRVRLTGRQLDVLRCVALGMANEEIARQLVIAPGTVAKHLENAYSRLGVTSRTAAVARVFGDSGDA